MNIRRSLQFSLLASLALVLAFALATPLTAQQYDESLFKEMRWRSIGPFRGGRVLAVAGVPGDANTFYFGGVAGGVWKTADGGLNWSPISDKLAVSSIGSIAVAPSDPNVIYVGTGEACIRGNISHGDGVYKSTDAGKTWQHVGLRDTRHIGRVVVHPRNPDLVYVAALGHVYGTNTERGIFRSRDGGKSWEKVLYVDEKSGGIEIDLTPANPSIIFAAIWEANRTPWSMSSGGPGSGLYKSTDGGSTWRKLTGAGKDAARGLPKGTIGRIGVSVSGADPNRVFALVEADDGGLYVTDDAGDSWRLVNSDRQYRQRAWYYTHVIADPKAVDTVYVLNTGFYRSKDGGRIFTQISTPHGDNHGLWIDPTNPDRMINGNDGGTNVSQDGAKSWTAQDNQPTAQFYHVITDNRFPYFVYGSQQDNSTVGIASRSDSGTITREDWYDVGGCESGYIAVDPRDPNIVYAGCYGGHITRFDKRTGQEQQISAWPENPMGSGADALKHRFQWTAPIVTSRHDPSVLYHAAEVLFKSTNGGMSWTAISPDLTRNDKSKQASSGGPITKDNTSVEYYDTIFTVAESPLVSNLIWAGTDDGLVHITRDGGKNWTNVTPKQIPEWSLISLVEPSPHDAATAYIAVDRHELDDFCPYIYRTSDYGKTWTQISSGIPETTFVRAVREDHKRRGLLYAGTETGVFVSFNDGVSWQSLQLNLPTAPIHDLVIKNDDLVVATHGRSFWILDDLTPLHQLNDTIAKSDVYLYKPGSVLRSRAGGGGGGGGGGGPRNAGQNPPAGAVLYYFLKQAPGEKDEITLEILDAKNALVRKFSNKPPATPPAQSATPTPGLPLPAGAGMNRYIWNTRHEGATNIPGQVLWSANTAGPLAAPGAYTLRLTVAGKTYTQPLELKLDPRVTWSQADIEKQFDLALKIRNHVSDAHNAVNQIRELRAQLAELRKRLAGNDKAKSILDSAAALDKKMTPIEEAIYQTKARSNQDLLNYPIRLNNKLAALQGIVESADTAPTAQSIALFDDLSKQLDVQLALWKEIVAKDVPALNAAIQREQIPLLVVTAALK